MQSDGTTTGPDGRTNGTRKTRPVRAPRFANGNGRNGHARNGHSGGDLAEAEQIDQRKLLEVLTALRKGNFTPRLPAKWTGVAGKVADTVNEVMEVNQRMAKELERLARIVGKEGVPAGRRRASTPCARRCNRETPSSTRRAPPAAS